MITRAELARRCGISQSKLRRILQALQIQPDKVQTTQKGLPIYYYQQKVLQQLQKYLKMLEQKLHNKVKTCCVCRQKIPESAMVGSRCMDCYVQKACNTIIYGNKWWDRSIHITLIRKAIEYLKKFI